MSTPAPMKTGVYPTHHAPCPALLTHLSNTASTLIQSALICRKIRCRHGCTVYVQSKLQVEVASIVSAFHINRRSRPQQDNKQAFFSILLLFIVSIFIAIRPAFILFYYRLELLVKNCSALYGRTLFAIVYFTLSSAIPLYCLTLCSRFPLVSSAQFCTHKISYSFSALAKPLI